VGDTATAIAVDRDGNPIVTGYIYGGYETVKYSGAGAPVWTNIFGAGNGYALAIDDSNNVYVSGCGLGGFTTIKYSDSGVPLWTNLFGAGVNTPTAIAVDGNQNVFIAGRVSGAGSGFDFATIKYSGAGTPLWTNVFNGSGNASDTADALAIDKSGNVIVTGYATGIGTGGDFMTIKYSSAGEPLWTNIFNGNQNILDRANRIAVDSSGNAIVTGYANALGTTFSDCVTIKYSSTGAPLWTNVFDGDGSGSNRGQDVAIDAADNVIITGYGTDNGSGNDFVTIKYSNSGAPLWTNIFNGSGNGVDQASSEALDGNGNVYVTGYSTAIGGHYVYTTIKYSNAGIPVWTNLFDLAQNNRPSAIAVDKAGNAFVTGFSGNSFQNYATIKYSGPPPIDFRFAVTNGNFGFIGNQFSLQLVGPANSNAIISVSTNLQNWVPISTNPLTGNPLTITDPAATNYNQRFYRAELR